MRVANPIYDVAFKYLMEDAEIARQLIEQITGEEILSLELRPQEFTGRASEYGVAILRVDFRAIIQTQDEGTKKVLIELQKGWYAADIQRFRKYLGENYSKTDNYNSAEAAESLPIITIYFLGFNLKQVDTSIVKVNRVYHDLVNNRELTVREPFIEQLTHDSYVIQIGRLREPYKTKLEQLLRIFDQTYIASDDNRILILREHELALHPLLRLMAHRLREAASDEEMLKQMQIEAEVERQIAREIRKVMALQDEVQGLKTSLKEQEQALEEKERLIEELQRKLDEENE